ncbi:MAG: VWA domain-containing protein [Paludibacteraceae bacterium]|nr:VWA domain-containing protein [Paludibacteraceae bacterium]
MLFINQKKKPAEVPVPQVADEKTHIFNLIILDESGSMGSVRDAAWKGCNEVLSGIRKTQKEKPELLQHVSLLPFNTGEHHYIVKDKMIDEVSDLRSEDYDPSSCTALYDAMGFSLNELEREVDKYDDAVGLVTIITDGYENASVEFSGKAIYDLVERLKKKGWTFAFMGANQDVMKVASTLNIKNAVEFKFSEQGVASAFEADRAAKEGFFNRIMNSRSKTRGMTREQRRAYYSQQEAQNDYFVNDEKEKA